MNPSPPPPQDPASGSPTESSAALLRPLWRGRLPHLRNPRRLRHPRHRRLHRQSRIPLPGQHLQHAVPVGAGRDHGGGHDLRDPDRRLRSVDRLRLLALRGGRGRGRHHGGPRLRVPRRHRGRIRRRSPQCGAGRRRQHQPVHHDGGHRVHPGRRHLCDDQERGLRRARHGLRRSRRRPLARLPLLGDDADRLPPGGRAGAREDRLRRGDLRRRRQPGGEPALRHPRPHRDRQHLCALGRVHGRRRHAHGVSAQLGPGQSRPCHHLRRADHRRRGRDISRRRLRVDVADGRGPRHHRDDIERLRPARHRRLLPGHHQGLDHRRRARARRARPPSWPTRSGA